MDLSLFFFSPLFPPSLHQNICLWRFVGFKAFEKRASSNIYPQKSLKECTNFNYLPNFIVFSSTALSNLPLSSVFYEMPFVEAFTQ